MPSFLFVPYSTAGHVHPMLPVMAELAAAGATVRALVGAQFGDSVRDTGADVVPLAAVPDVFVPDGVVGAARFAIGFARRPGCNARAASSLAREISHRRPDLVVLDPMLPWAERVTRRSGLPSALFSTTFADGAEVRAAVGGVSRWAARLRPQVRRRHRSNRLVLANALPELQPAAGSMSGDVHLVAPLRRPRRPTVGSSDWQAPAGHRMLYVSPGTVFARRPGYFRTIADAFADRPWLVIAATGPLDPARCGPMPTNVLLRQHVQQLAVLQQCDVFLTHAGMNSCLEALAAGVPMALAPRSREQRFIAARITALGAGMFVDIHDPTRLYQGVTALADDHAVRTITAVWRQRLADTDGAGHAAALLLERVRLIRTDSACGCPEARRGH